MNEKLFQEIDEVSRKLDGLSRVVGDIAYRASGKRAPEVSCTQSTDVQQLKAEIAALVVKVDVIPQRELPLMVGEFIERMRQLSAV